MSKRAALYFRQSLDAQEGIERQRERCSALVSARGWVVVGEYIDNDTSASKARAAGTAWARLLDDATHGRFDVAVAVDLDRLVRSTRDLVTLADTGVGVLTVDGEIDLTTADGEFRATMLAGIARFETRRKGERQKRANTQRAMKGLPHGPRAFGYEPDGVTIRESEAVELRAAYRAVLAGASLGAVVRDWNARGIATSQRRYKAGHEGEPAVWKAQTLRYVLLNPRNVGKRRHHGEVVGDAAWPAIVDEATWLGVQAVLSDPTRLSAARGGKYLLSGLAVCGVCGATVHGGGARRVGQRTYRCSESTGHIARRAEVIEEYVGEVVIARLSLADAAGLLTAETGVELQALATEADSIRARLTTLAVDFADGALTGAQLRVATERLRGRLGDVEGRIAESSRADVLGPLVAADSAREAWEALSTDARRQVINALATVRIGQAGQGAKTFRPETVAIEWKQ
ncbi:recombinase family protein [Agrococcus sp. SCSIO52902]|uniref:recombinase family protein n=1 Tax=Agrococcus sp. SCSIO52902 TaxID=2933290 RepID=UPI001FF1030B|nr:recombinase family protein [Agrococcus sp. SCSIO52902]UOW00827.1 recombinase family protein [Agrococcus sp. SCSIO52902]UOW00890.1 recombinase family protein [Agrococcus sp. SCSIO52902]